MLSSTPLPGHAPALTQPFGLTLWCYPLLGNYWDEAMPELSTGEQVRPSCTWNRETIGWNNSEITGRAGGMVPACPSFQAPMWDIWSFKPVLMPFLAALTCLGINAYIEARQIESLQQWKEHRQGLFPWSRPLRRIFRLSKDCRGCLDLNGETEQHRSKIL